MLVCKKIYSRRDGRLLTILERECENLFLGSDGAAAARHGPSLVDGLFFPKDFAPRLRSADTQNIAFLLRILKKITFCASGEWEQKLDCFSIWFNGCFCLLLVYSCRCRHQLTTSIEGHFESKLANERSASLHSLPPSLFPLRWHSQIFVPFYWFRSWDSNCSPHTSQNSYRGLVASEAFASGPRQLNNSETRTGLGQVLDCRLRKDIRNKSGSIHRRNFPGALLTTKRDEVVK